MHGLIGGRWGAGITDVAEMSEKPSGQRLHVTSRIAKPAAYLTQSEKFCQ